MYRESARHEGEFCGLWLVIWSVVELRDVRYFIAIQTLDVFFLHQAFDILLNVRDFGWEPSADLLDDFLYKLDMLHALAGLHDTHNSRLEKKS